MQVLDLAGWEARLSKHDIDFKRESHGHYRSIYFNDPNGIMIEFHDRAEAMGAGAVGEADRSAGLEVLRGWARDRGLKPIE